MKKSDLLIYTSFVSPLTLPEFIEKGLLPIFIVRSISNSALIGAYESTPVHMKQLSPSADLYRKKRDGLITVEEFKKLYALEIGGVNLSHVIRDLEMLVDISEAKGVVLLGYGSNYDVCHRSVLAKLLGDYVDKPIKEVII